MTLFPNNGDLARGENPFLGGSHPGQSYRFYTETVPLATPGPDGEGFATRDQVEILQAGDNKTIPVRIVTPEWLEANPAAAAAHRAWKHGRNIATGTPLDSWSAIDRAMVSACAVYNIFSVEQLAAVDDERLLRLGMGARDLRERARLYLDTQKDAAAVARVRAENDAMAAQLAATQEQMRMLQEQMEKLLQTQQPVETALAEEGPPSPAPMKTAPAQPSAQPVKKPSSAPVNPA